MKKKLSFLFLGFFAATVFLVSPNAIPSTIVLLSSAVAGIVGPGSSTNLSVSTWNGTAGTSLNDNPGITYNGGGGTLLSLSTNNAGIAIGSTSTFGYGLLIRNNGGNGNFITLGNGVDAALNVTSPASGEVRFATDSSSRFISLAGGDGTTPALYVKGDHIELPLLTTPASSSASCVKGTINLDASFFYFCVATNTWKRAALATW